MYLKRLLVLVCVSLLLISELAPLALAATTPAPAASKAAVPAAKPAAPKLATISAINGNANTLVVKADGKLNPAAKVLTAPDRILIYVPNAQLAYNLNKSGSVVDPFTGVSGVRVSSDATSARIIIDLTTATKYTIQPSATGFSVVLGEPPAAVKSPTPVKTASPAAKTPVATAKPASAAPVIEEEPVIEIIKPVNTAPVQNNTVIKPQEPSGNPDIKTISFGEKYSEENPYITINAKDADIRDILQMFADRANLNLILDKSVTGNISLSINGMPFNDALNVVLKLNELSAKKIGTTLVVAATSEFAKKELETTVAKSIKLNNAKPADVAAIIKQSLPSTSKANIVVDDRTSSILITGSQTDLDRAEAVVAAVDTRSKQVMMEVKLIDLSEGGLETLGTRFGQNSGTTSGSFNAPPGIAAGLANGVQLSYNSMGALTNQFIATIDLLVKTQKAKVLATPMIATQENLPATVNITDSIVTGVQSTTTNFGQSTTITTTEVGMKVNITPKISYDGSITMEVNPVLTAKGDQLNPGGQIPIYAKVTREAKTTLRVQDGETLMIAGLKQTQVSTGVSKVPLLGDLPGIGFLFSYSSTDRKTSDVIILITPHLINDPAVTPGIAKDPKYSPETLIKENKKVPTKDKASK